MKSKKNLVLIGMMSSGKSTIGGLLAKKLNFKFFDIDKIIENETKMKIAEIFKIKGENFFRNLEEKTTIKLLNFSDSVISLGGGGFVNETIRNIHLDSSYGVGISGAGGGGYLTVITEAEIENAIRPKIRILYHE